MMRSVNASSSWPKGSSATASVGAALAPATAGVVAAAAGGRYVSPSGAALHFGAMTSDCNGGRRPTTAGSGEAFGWNQNG